MENEVSQSGDIGALKRNYSWRKMKSTLLMRIANAVMANYDNTEKEGLFDGKMGLCLFFYN